MKHNSKKFLITAMVFVLATLMAFAMPVTAYAQSTELLPTVVTVVANGVHIDPADAEFEEKPVYEMEVWANGASFSSYELSFRMPSFVQVEELVLDSALENMDNEVFTYYVAEDGRVNTAFSCPENVDGVRLFTIRFTVKDYSEAYGDVEYISSTFATFTDTDVKPVASTASLGYVQIGEPDFAMMGDVDSNGEINLADLLVIQRGMVNPNFPLSEQQRAVADINHDGEVNIYDCQYIQNYLVGRIDSLENIYSGSTGTDEYHIDITITDQNGNILFAGSRQAKMDASYESFMTPIFVELSQSYTITGNLSIWSEVHGTVDPNSNGEGFVVTGNDKIMMVVSVDYSNAPGATVQYTATHTVHNDDGSYKVFNWTFYTNYTAQGEVTEYSADGVQLGDPLTYPATWQRNGDIIEMIAPTEALRFADNYDGITLHYIGTTGSLISWIFPGVRIGLTVGASAEDLIAKIVGKEFTAIKGEGGEAYTYTISEDCIDYSKVDFNKVGCYPVEVCFVFEEQEYRHDIDCYIVEDMSEATVIGRYEVEKATAEEMELAYITLYEGGRMMLEDYLVIDYEFMQEGVIFFVFEEIEVLLQLNDEGKSACFYTPAADEKVIDIYTLTYAYMYDGLLTYTYTVYGEYTTPGYYIATLRVESSELDEPMVIGTRVYLDKENSKLTHAAGCNMTFDAENKLQENHDYQPKRVEPTCTQEGYEGTYCIHCNRSTGASTSIPKTDHNYGDDDICDDCSYDKAQLETLRAELLKSMETRWEEICNKYGYEVKDSWQESFDKYYNEVNNAADEDTMWNVQKDFEELMRSIENGWGGGGDDDQWPTNWWIDFGDSYYSDTVTQGDSIEEYVNDYIIGKELVLQFADGSEVRVPVDWTMIGNGMGTFDQVGVFEINVHCAQGVFSVTNTVFVTVKPNLEGVEGVDYTFNDTAFMGWNMLHLYQTESGNYAEICGLFYSFGYHTDDVIWVNYQNYTVLISLDKDGKTATYYTPDESDGFIGTYTYEDGMLLYTVTVYGEYNGEGEYTAVVTRKWADSEQPETLTTTVYLNLAEDQNTVQINYIGGMFGIDGENKLYRYGMEEKPDFDFDAYRDQVKDEIKMLWSEIEQGDWSVSQEQYDEYNSIMECIYQVTEQWELDKLCEQAIALCNRIKGVREIDYTDWIGIPSRVVVGTTMEEFLSILGSAKFIIYYTDGTSEEISLSADNFNLSNLNLDQEGEYQLPWSVYIEALGEYYNAIKYLDVIANMVADANIKGSYTYLGQQEGNVNMMDCTYIMLYDNNQVALYDEFGLMMFMEYTQEGNLVIFENGGIEVLFEIKYDSEGGAIGIACYRVENPTVYTYADEDVTMTVEVFYIDGKSYAFVSLSEINADGSIDGTYEICGTVEIDGDRISGAILEDEYTITEGNVLVPVESSNEMGDTTQLPSVNYD